MQDRSICVFPGKSEGWHYEYLLLHKRQRTGTSKNYIKAGDIDKVLAKLEIPGRRILIPGG